MDNNRKIENELEALAKFVKETMKELRSLQAPIIQETSKKGELAKDQLQKVTSTTEEATFNMLEKVNHLMDLSEQVKSIINDAKENNDIKKLDEVDPILEETQMDIMEIMQSLQFQDIASQQIAHVDDLITAVINRLNQLSKILNIEEKDIYYEDNTSRSYDPNASMKKAKSQDEIDELVKRIKGNGK